MKHYITILNCLFLFLFAGISACNRTANELPPYVAPVLSYSMPCIYHGNELVQLTFFQMRKGSSDTVKVMVTNKTSSVLTNLKILVEVCDASVQNFDNCAYPKIVQVDSLGPYDTTGLQILYVDRNVQLREAYINAGILSFDGSNNPVSGLYLYRGANFAAFEKADTLAPDYADARGYVFADGVSLFRFKSKSLDSVYYNAQGDFISHIAYSGKLYEKGRILSLLSLDSLVSTNGIRQLIADTTGNGLRFRLRIKNPVGDSIYSIFVNIQKDHIQ